MSSATDYPAIKQSLIELLSDRLSRFCGCPRDIVQYILFTYLRPTIGRCHRGKYKLISSDGWQEHFIKKSYNYMHQADNGELLFYACDKMFVVGLNGSIQRIESETVKVGNIVGIIDNTIIMYGVLGGVEQLCILGNPNITIDMPAVECECNIDARNNIFISYTGQIDKYNIKGQLVRQTILENGSSRCCFINELRDGSLIAISVATGKIVHLSPDGKLIREISGYSIYRTCLLLDADDNIIIITRNELWIHTWATRLFEKCFTFDNLNYSVNQFTIREDGALCLLSCSNTCDGGIRTNKLCMFMPDKDCD